MDFFSISRPGGERESALERIYAEMYWNERIEIGRRGARPVDGDVYYAARGCRDCVPLLSFYRHVPIVTAAHCSINVEL